MIKLFITRHGMTSWNEQGRLQGHSDSPLSKQGIEDATALSKYIKKYHIDEVYSSSLPRAYDTATLIFKDRIIKKDDRLKEMSFGIAEGKFVEQLLDTQDYINLWDHPEQFNGFENGETYDQLFERLNSFINYLQVNEDGKNIFITTHGLTRIVLMAIFKGLSKKELSTINRKVVRGGSLTIVELDNGKANILYEGIDHYLKPINEVKSFIKK